MPKMNLIRVALLALSLMMSRSVIAALDVPEVGPHQKVLVFEKSENPQNILIAYTKVNEKCEPQQDSKSGKPVFDFYWLMNRDMYKPVHSLIKSGIRDRITIEKIANSPKFYIHLQEMQEIQQDFKEARVLIQPRPGAESCELEALITLGPSNQSKVLRLHSIYSESRKTLVPPFRKVVSVTLKGEDVKTGKPFERLYPAR